MSTFGRGGCFAASQNEVKPQPAAAGKAIQAVGIAGHAVGTVAKAKRLPHKP